MAFARFPTGYGDVDMALVKVFMTRYLAEHGGQAHITADDMRNSMGVNFEYERLPTQVVVMRKVGL